MLAQRTQNRRRVGVGWRCDEAGITGSAEWWVSAVVALPTMMSCPVFGATRVWRHLVIESLPDPPLSAGFHHSAPTYVGAENTRAAPSGPALQGLRRQLRLGRVVGLRRRGCAQDRALPRIWRHPVI